MSEPAPTRAPSHYAPARGRHMRSASDHSPTSQHHTDDLLSNLAPRTVADAFRNPSGSLKACIEAATPAEQAFALRVAIASNSIHDWLAELSTWPWPAAGGSEGFEAPTVRRKLFSSRGALLKAENQEPQSSVQGYTGSVPTTNIAKYERRIDEISQGLEELDIEEIKSQVLNNHIMPLSRPGTPIMDAGRSVMSSLSSIARLDDLTALVTATTVQALPNLSKLARLMGAWNLRLLVLRKIPVFLMSIADAEAALQSGWNAIIGLGADGQSGPAGTPAATMSRADIEVMKAVLGRKVAKTGHDLDAMLDILEGQPDTLPEDWIDRVDALEHGYGEWSVACERKMKEADLAGPVQVASAEGALDQPPLQGTNGDAVAAPPATNGSIASAPREESASPSIGSTTVELSPSPKTLPPVIKIHPTTEDQELEEELLDTDNEFDEGTLNGSSVESPAMLVSGPDDVIHEDEEWNPPVARGSPNPDSDLSDISEHEVQIEGRSRRASTASVSSTVLHGAPSATDSFSSDLLDYDGTPERPRQRGLIRDDDVSGFQSFQSSTRSLSVSFSDKPTITELPSFESPSTSPTKSSIMEDDLATEPNSPVERSMPGGDDQLQRQIGEILESVPAKIRLRAEPPAINLNPPDFKMPTRKTSRSDLMSRSQSNLSMRSAYSRSGTPSFTLAPAHSRNSRPRHQRGNQEIKLYHLSRSNGEAPIKLFIRCVGEHGERVMVRVGGGWADLGEYLKEYASHHLRRSAGAGTDGKIEVKDIPRTGAVRPVDSPPPSRPNSAMDSHSPISPLKLRKTRRLSTAPYSGNGIDQTPPPLPAALRPKTPLSSRLDATPPSDASSARSRSSSRVSWDEEDGSAAPLGMAGPRAKQIEMSEESRAWVESVKEKVRIASGERKGPPVLAPPLGAAGGVGAAAGVVGGGGLEASLMDRGGDGKGMFGEMGKVGGTKRLFRRGV